MQSYYDEEEFRKMIIVPCEPERLPELQRVLESNGFEFVDPLEGLEYGELSSTFYKVVGQQAAGVCGRMVKARAQALREELAMQGEDLGKYTPEELDNLEKTVEAQVFGHFFGIPDPKWN